VPSLVDGSRTPYEVLGAGYAILAAIIFVAAALRQRLVRRALDAGRYEDVGDWGVLALTVVATALALGTLAIIVVQP